MGTKEIIELLPPDMQLIFQRASSHTLIRRAKGELPLSIKAGISDFPVEDNPPMYVIIPRQTFLIEFAYMRERERALKEDGLSLMTEAIFKRDMEEWCGINIFLSPPKNLTKFFEKNFLSEDFLFDIDIDYFSEFQGECFSPNRGIQRKDFGYLPRVLKLIRKYQPEILTISEMKNSALNDSKSRFSNFMKRIQELGYEVDYSNIIDEEDTEIVSKIIRLIKFIIDIQHPLQEKYSGENLEEYYEELANEIKRFFE